MKIAVFGLGYVGCVTAASLAARGHIVVGVDTNPNKVASLQAGEAPVLEPGLPELVARTVAERRLIATEDAQAAVTASDLSLVCVGTPSAADGAIDIGALERVTTTIGGAIAARPLRHTVVIRSTTIPGTCEATVRPLLEQASGLRVGADVGLAVNPEFMREGTSIEDFNNPPKTVVGGVDEASADVTASLYDDLTAPLFTLPVRVAEMVKYADNAFHALKIGFANEVGVACRALAIDSHEVMRVFCADHKLNISSAYLRPGFAFGGSCLSKDLRALLHAARHADVELPILESILPSNERHLQRAVEAVLGLGRRRVGIFGLAFKQGTDDLRESPLVELAERLLGKGLDLRIYDPAVSPSGLVGANREFIERRLPHLSTLLVDSAEELLRHSDVCVVGALTAEAERQLSVEEDHHLIDLVRLPDASRWREDERYFGIAW
jgi:GDP-mannose 6-dehydrogenase